jgi:hypothetical protein
MCCRIGRRRKRSRPTLRYYPIIVVDVFWVMTPCSAAVVCQRFGGPCCLHLQGEVRNVGFILQYCTASQSRRPLHSRENLISTIPSFIWKDWGKSQKKLSQDSLSFGRDSNLKPSEYEEWDCDVCCDGLWFSYIVPRRYKSIVDRDNDALYYIAWLQGVHTFRRFLWTYGIQWCKLWLHICN